MKQTADRFFDVINNGITFDIGIPKPVSPEHIIVTGSIGSGKTIFINQFATNMKHYRGVKVIYLTEKADSACENAFCGIETNNQEQIMLLEKDLMKDTAIKQEKIEILHPFTFDFPSTLVPDVFKLYTLPIKDVSELGFSALLSRELESPTVNLCKEVVEELNDNDDIFGFLFKAFQKSSMSDDNETVRIARSTRFPYIMTETYGSKRDIEQIRVTSKIFEKCFVLQNNHCDLNLTDERFIKIINDVETTTFFSFWRIKDEKLKYFLLIELLVKLHRIIPENAKHPLLIIIEEVKILFPKVLTLKYVRILCEELVKMLMGIRTSGRGVTCVFTTQSYYETNPLIRDSVSDGNVILMRLSHEDQSSFNRDAGLSSANYNIVTKIKKGQFVFLKDIKNKYDDALTYRAFYVPYAHREPGLPSFWEYWRQKYPDRMIKFNETINNLQKIFDKEKEEAIKRQEDFLNKKVDKKKTDKEETTRFPNYEDKVEEKPKLNELTIKTKQKCYEAVINTPEASWNSRIKAELVEGINDVIILQKASIDYALENGDLEFIKKFIPRKFFKRYYLEHYSEIFESNIIPPTKVGGFYP